MVPFQRELYSHLIDLFQKQNNFIKTMSSEINRFDITFLWGSLKKGMLTWIKLNELIENIYSAFQVVTPKVLTATFRNMQRRVQLCLRAQREHFQHLLKQHNFLNIQAGNVLGLSLFPSVLFLKSTFCRPIFKWDTVY